MIKFQETILRLFISMMMISCLTATMSSAIAEMTTESDLRASTNYNDITGNFPAPSPLLSPPPVYDHNRTATVVISGTDVQNSMNPNHNDFGVGGEITLSSGLDFATVYPNDAPGTYKVINASELVSNLSFAYFAYYAQPLAQYTARNSATMRGGVTAALNASMHNPNFATAAVVIKQLNAFPAGGPGDVYVSFEVWNALNTSALPDIPSSLLDFGELSILNVPCSGAGIEC